MMYQEARGRFQAIIEADPACAMAYWGTATTLFQPLWATRPSGEEVQRGWRLIAQARERVESRREALLIEATGAFFREPDTAEFPTRLRRWAEAMKAPYEAYPQDPDIASLYALSRLTLAQRADERDPLFDEAESLLRRVQEKHPGHPGAIHYTIHATDADGRAENALDVVRAYRDIAPEVPHAMHMPSHIYVRLGEWPKVIEWNRESADAALEHPVNGAVSHHYIHAADYLAYAHLQRGDGDRAGAVVEEALAKGPYQRSFISAFHAASMPARLAVERRNWKRAAELEPRNPDYLPWDESPWAEGQTWYARGLGAVHTGDLNAAQEAEARLRTLRENASAAGDEDIATYIEIDRRVLDGRIAHAQGDGEKALALTRQAAELEATVEKHPVAPGALLPPYEALGDLLVELDRPAEALKAYRKADEAWPGRYHTRAGMARVAEAVDE
jgi:tetratricopeptide (TPR) repeat protein